MTERWDYWNGSDDEDRREAYAEDFKPEYQANGDDVQRRISAVLTAFRSETQVELPEGYASGWRPASVNDATANSGKLSNHLVADAGDKRDSPDGDFTWWCFRNPHILEAQGLWMEHPSATVLRSWALARAQKREPTPWCHLQRTPPASHNRVFFPDAKSPGEWQAFVAAGGQPGMTYAAWADLGRGRQDDDDDDPEA